MNIPADRLRPGHTIVDLGEVLEVTVSYVGDDSAVNVLTLTKLYNEQLGEYDEYLESLYDIDEYVAVLDS